MSLPAGKSHADAVERAKHFREILWSRTDWMSRPEDERLDELDRLCTALYLGDPVAGKALATEVIYA